ncbi:hypothetical protein AAKU55_004926 [Oxalobacteraceae bacterium GrIS 1.11]
MSEHMNLSTSTPWPSNAIPENWVESLFKKMSFTYGVKFADQWRGIDADGLKRHWAEKLGGLTGEELRRGVAKLDTRDWPPTLPEFVKLCKPGIDPMVAYYEAMEQGARRERGDPDEWSCPAIYWAWRKIGVFDFAHAAYATLKPRWEAALAAEFAKEASAPIPAQAKALPAPGKTQLSSEKARQLLDEFNAQDRSGRADVFGDSKRWARNIVARRARGEHMAIAQIEAAEQALGLR